MKQINKLDDGSEIYNDNGVFKIKKIIVQEQEINEKMINQKLIDLNNKNRDLQIEINKNNVLIANYENILNKIKNTNII